MAVRQLPASLGSAAYRQPALRLAIRHRCTTGGSGPRSPACDTRRDPSPGKVPKGGQFGSSGQKKGGASCPPCIFTAMGGTSWREQPPIVEIGVAVLAETLSPIRDPAPGTGCGGRVRDRLEINPQIDRRGRHERCLRRRRGDRGGIRGCRRDRRGDGRCIRGGRRRAVSPRDHSVIEVVVPPRGCAGEAQVDVRVRQQADGDLVPLVGGPREGATIIFVEEYF